MSNTKFFMGLFLLFALCFSVIVVQNYNKQVSLFQRWGIHHVGKGCYEVVAPDGVVIPKIFKDKNSAMLYVSEIDKDYVINPELMKKQDRGLYWK